MAESRVMESMTPKDGRTIAKRMARAYDIHKQTKGQAGFWILHRQSPMMQAHVSEIVPLGAIDWNFAEA
jgi:hypothetical protein